MNGLAKLLKIILFLFRQLIAAAKFNDLVLNHLLVEKRNYVKETIELNEKEGTVFWPLYDDYEKNKASIFFRYSTFLKKYTQEHENMSNAKAEEIMQEILTIQTDDFEAKQTYFKKLRLKLPDKRLFQYFVIEERVNADFYTFLLKELPKVK